MKTVLVTGATSGIGLAASRALAARGFRVLMVGRDPARTEAARRSVASAATGPAPVVLLADLSSLAAVRSLAATVRARGEVLDVLFNNAGAILSHRDLTDDGIERTFALNHLSPFLLTRELTDVLRAAPQGRVVTTSSQIHAAKLDFGNLQGERRFSAIDAYARSKLCNVLFTAALARRLSGTRMTANCFAPGLVATGFGRGSGVLMGLGLRLVMAMPLARTPAQGAASGVRLAADEDVHVLTGKYFYDGRPIPPKRIGQDAGVAERLWEASETLLSR